MSKQTKQQQQQQQDQTQPIKSLFDDLNKSLWWEYKEYNDREQDDIRNFLQQHWSTLQQQMSKNIFECFKVCAQALGVHTHPALEMPSYFLQADLLNDPEDHPQHHQQNKEVVVGAEGQTKEVNFLLINNFQIDYATAYILAQVWPFSTVSLFKLSHIACCPSTLQVLIQIIMNPNNKVSKVFLEWVQLDQEQQVKWVGALGKSECLEMLVLRACKLSQQAIEALVDNLINNTNVQLKFLDLYDNQLTSESYAHLATLLNKNRTLETLGLSKNNISDLSTLEPLFQQIGKFQLTEEELEQYRNKEKEKEQILLRNQKLKNKQQAEPVPYLDPIQQNADQTFSVLRNMKMQMINLSVNMLGDDCREVLDKFINQSHDKFTFILTNNQFSDKCKEKLKKKMNKRIHF